MNETSWVIYHNPQCSKSREALSFLKSKGIEPRVIEYLKETPSEDELQNIISMLAEPPAAIVRVKEDQYKELAFDTSSTSEIMHHLARHPRLIERPIVIKGRKAVIARPIEKIEQLF